ncbi:hypothetical protein H0H93_002748, partial [Arthromyces matolae]
MTFSPENLAVPSPGSADLITFSPPNLITFSPPDLMSFTSPDLNANNMDKMPADGQRLPVFDMDNWSGFLKSLEEPMFSIVT